MRYEVTVITSTTFTVDLSGTPMDGDDPRDVAIEAARIGTGCGWAKVEQEEEDTTAEITDARPARSI